MNLDATPPRFELLASVCCLATILIFSGCASMSKNECLNAQWRNIGYEDGARGFRATRIAEHRQACADYGVSPDLEEYAVGRQLGLAEWCSAANGFYQGRKGRSYTGVCPPELEAAFLAGMNHGREVYSYSLEIDTLEKKVRRDYDELEFLDEEIASLEDEIISGRIGPNGRRQRLHDLRVLEQEREYLLQTIAEDEQRLESMEDTLDLLQEQYHPEYEKP